MLIIVIYVVATIPTRIRRIRSSTSSTPSCPSSLQPLIESIEPYDGLNLVDGRPYEESMRVTYEDPGQRDEKRRLMSLFETQTPEGAEGEVGKEGRGRKGSASATVVRRSTRMAGF